MGHFVYKAVAQGFLTDDDLVVIDQNGKCFAVLVDPLKNGHASCCVSSPSRHYSVVHAHPPLSIAFTVAGQSLASVLPEVVLTLGVIPTIPYATTGTELLAQKVGEAIVNHDAVLMDRHGAVCAGTNLLEAFCRLETMEHTALITKTARDMGQVRSLPPEEAVHLRSMGLKRYGGPPSAVAKADSPKADLPDACMSCVDVTPEAHRHWTQSRVVNGSDQHQCQFTGQRPF